MRLNKFIAQATGLSRRAADQAISDGRILVNGNLPSIGMQISDSDSVSLDNSPLATSNTPHTTIILNKPVGYVCSRDGQGSKTIYELLPNQYQELKSVGRLDKNSSGLLLLTNDGNLAHELTHPKFQKTKIYKIALNKPLAPHDYKEIIDKGAMLDDGASRLHLDRINNTDDVNWKVTMTEGRNRQIRRTFEHFGYNVVKLHRTQFGHHKLNNIASGKSIRIN